MSAKGGITEGKSHKEGGIPMVVKSTGQQVELEGGEGVINKRNMASEKKFEFEGKDMTICEIASEINSADGNGVQIDCDNVTGTKYKYDKGGKILDENQEDSFKEWMEDGNVIELEKGVYSTQDAQYRNRLKGMDELRKYFKKEFYSDSYEGGGEVNNIYVHKYNPNITLEVIEYTNRGVKGLQRNPKSLSKKEKKEGIIVMYSDAELKELFAKKYEEGGGVKDYNSLIGKYVNIYSMGVSSPTEYQIKDLMVSGENFRYRYITLKFDIGIAPIPLDEGEAFLNNEIIYVNDNKEEFGIQLIPNQMAKGGEVDLPKANKMFHLPLELAVYVPSTQDVDKVISDSELEERVNEVSEYLARLFGGFTKSDKIGGFMSSKSELVTEDVVPVVSFATKEDFEANKEKLVNKLSEWAKRWGQEAIGFEFEGDLYYVPEKFAKGGDVRDMSWYQDFKKQELKRGTEHEMEHIDTIKKFKKEGVSDKEVAKAIAKDHLEEDENYYIELDMLEERKKLSEAMKKFGKYKSYKSSSKKYALGGYMGEEKTKVQLVLSENFNGVLRGKDGEFVTEDNLVKGKLYTFNFIHNDGRHTALSLGDTGTYYLVPNDIINVVGFEEEKYGNGGEVKAYQSMNLDSNDKSILKELLKIDDIYSVSTRLKEKLASFKGNNVVNDLSPILIQKIYGLLFKYHSVEHPILNLYLSNIGVGNILMYAPTYLESTLVSYDESNKFAEIEKEISYIVTLGKRATIIVNQSELKNIDAIIHVYPQTNPKEDELTILLSQISKVKGGGVALGVCEFSTRDKLNEFQQSILENQGSMSSNQMIMFKKSNDYMIINEGIREEANYTLIYVMNKY